MLRSVKVFLLMKTNKPFQRLPILAASAGLVLLMACEHKTFDFGAFAAARARWLSHNCTTYRVDQERMCFSCSTLPGTVQLLIVNNQITAGSSTAEVRPLSAGELASFKTVDQLFEWIEQTRKSGPDHFAITYDDDYGYPARIEYDGSESAVDDEVTYLLRNLQVITDLNSIQPRSI